MKLEVTKEFAAALAILAFVGGLFALWVYLAALAQGLAS